MSAAVDQQDLQGNILCGYGFAHAHYVFAEVDQAGAGRELLAELASEVTSAVSWGSEKSAKPSHTLNVAVTAAGLRALGLPDELLARFAPEFVAGMAGRAGLLGDHGPADPQRWEDGLGGPTAHVLITINAHDGPVVDEQAARWRRRVSVSGLSASTEIGAQLLAGGREHFGFADGFSQPAIDDPCAGPTQGRGHGTPTRWGWSDLKPGEFVLGLPDEDGEVTADPLGRNGSYMVLRKLAQDVGLFHRSILDASGGDPTRADWLAAKLVGRWQDGTPLVLSPEGPDARISSRPEGLNEFRFGDDPDGVRCPLGAHIRRVNPRDSFGDGRRSRRQRIVRRGMPYGPAPDDPLVDDGVDRGLVFVCYQASIARQFETVQSLWCNDGDAFGRGGECDALLAGDDPNGRMTIPGDPPVFVSPQRRFVTCRGGEYLYVPGLTALRALANGAFSMD